MGHRFHIVEKNGKKGIEGREGEGFFKFSDVDHVEYGREYVDGVYVVRVVMHDGTYVIPDYTGHSNIGEARGQAYKWAEMIGAMFNVLPVAKESAKSSENH